MAWLKPSRQKEIDTAVDNVLQKAGASYPEDNLIEIVEKLGIDVFLSDFDEYADDISGIIKYPDGTDPKIYINSKHNKERRTFTLAHELGHYFLHRDGTQKYRIDKFNYSDGTKEALEETEANYFAASLLIPANKLARLLNETDDLGAIASYFGVSEVTVRNRVRWLQMN